MFNNVYVDGRRNQFRCYNIIVVSSIIIYYELLNQITYFSRTQIFTVISGRWVPAICLLIFDVKVKSEITITPETIIEVSD